MWNKGSELDEIFGNKDIASVIKSAKMNDGSSQEIDVGVLYFIEKRPTIRVMYVSLIRMSSIVIFLSIALSGLLGLQGTRQVEKVKKKNLNEILNETIYFCHLSLKKNQS